MRKQIEKIYSKKAQALIVLIIFLAITLLLVTSISFSAIKTSEVVRRNITFQSSFDKAESLLDEAAHKIDNGQFDDINKYDELGRLIGKADLQLQKDQFVDILKDTSVNVDVNEQAGTTSGLPMNGYSMVVDCYQKASTAVELTLVYSSGGVFKVDKQLYKCDAGTPITGASSMDTLQNGYYTKTVSNMSSYSNLYLVRVKAFGDKVKTRVSLKNGATTIAGTAKYLIIASGVESDGSSSSTIQVEKPAGYYLPPIFDYVFFQGN